MKVYAQIDSTLQAPSVSMYTLPQLVNIAINLVLGLGIAITIIFLILGGIQYATSKGDAKAAQTARQWLTNAVIGGIIVVGVFSLRNLIYTAIGVNVNGGNQINGVINFGS